MFSFWCKRSCSIQCTVDTNEVTIVRRAQWNLSYSDCIQLVQTVQVDHYNDVTMSSIASQITSLTIVYSAVYSGADQRKHQSSASLAFVRGIHRGPVNSPHKWPVTRKMFPFDDVIMPWMVKHSHLSILSLGVLLMIWIPIKRPPHWDRSTIKFDISRSLSRSTLDGVILVSLKIMACVICLLNRSQWHFV